MSNVLAPEPTPAEQVKIARFGFDKPPAETMMTATTELIAEAREGNFEDRGWMIDVIDRLADALEAATAAPSDTDLREDIASIIDWETGDWEKNYRAADAIMALLSRTAQPVQVEVTTADVDRVAAAIAKAADADYWVDEIAEWEGSDEWEREAHPDNYPGIAYEDRAEFRKDARAAIAALGGGE